MSFSTFRVAPNPPRKPINDPKEVSDYHPECHDLSISHPSLAYLSLTPVPPPAPSRYQTAALSAYLQSLTHSILDILVNQKDLTHPLLLKHMSPFFVATTQDELPSTKDRLEHLTIWKDLFNSMPDVHVQVMDSVAQVHEDGRKANVWTFKRISGFYDGGICKEAVSMMMWERTKGQVWMCVRLKKMQGVSEWN